MKHTFTPYCLCFIFFFNISNNSFGQAPEIEWQNNIGGTKDDYLRSINESANGGYILAGFSASKLTGDKTEGDMGGNAYPNDYWPVKLSFTGTIEWQNTIGGSENDYMLYAEETTDGGVILGGNSATGFSGDKTEATITIGYADLWIIKTDSLGNILWQNDIGGNRYDYFASIHETSDHGFIVGAFSSSGISGDKTESYYNASELIYDYWIIKLDSNGTVLWENTIGGSSDDRLRNVLETPDGGFIVGGYSNSFISGDKTANSLLASYDYWIIKLDNTGVIEWQRSIGGESDDILATLKLVPDGGYILAGYSSSGVFGEKSEPNLGDSDYWIVRLNDSGYIVWQNTIGGEGSDHLWSIDLTTDAGFVLGGYSDSDISFDKSEGCFGGDDYWVIKVSSSGEIEWQTVVGGADDDKLYSIIQTSDNGFLLGGESTSSISGNKTENAYAGGEFGYDYWIVKLAPVCLPLTEICNSLDDNCNGIIDDGITESISISAGGATTFCQGGSVLLSATYSGASIQWKKNGSNIPGAIASTYSVNKSGNYSAVTTSPCGTATSSIINVTVNKNPNASISAGGATTFCAGGSVTLTEIPVAGCTYQWYKGASLIAGATSTNYIATTAGNYKCRVTKTATSCYKNSNAISVTVPCKEGEEIIGGNNSSFSIYPNPNNGSFEISVQNLASASPFFEGGLRPARMNRSDGGMIFEVYNSLGQLIYSQQINSSDNNFNETISIDNISSGIYFVRIGDGNNYAEQKLIIE